MKTILVILDGASEEKIEELNFTAPIEYAKTPVLDKMIKAGKHGTGPVDVIEAIIKE